MSESTSANPIKIFAEKFFNNPVVDDIVLKKEINQEELESEYKKIIGEESNPYNYVYRSQKKILYTEKEKEEERKLEEERDEIKRLEEERQKYMLEYIDENLLEIKDIKKQIADIKAEVDNIFLGEGDINTVIPEDSPLKKAILHTNNLLKNTLVPLTVAKGVSLTDKISELCKLYESLNTRVMRITLIFKLFAVDYTYGENIQSSCGRFFSGFQTLDLSSESDISIKNNEKTCQELHKLAKQYLKIDKSDYQTDKNKPESVYFKVNRTRKLIALEHCMLGFGHILKEQFSNLYKFFVLFQKGETNQEIIDETNLQIKKYNAFEEFIKHYL